MKFTERELTKGVRLHLCETDKFKSLTCKVFIQQELKDRDATSTALLPLLLRRGSERFPSTLQIARELEDLYAAEFGADVLKIGERQILEFYLQMVEPSLLPQGEELLERGLRSFWEIFTKPQGPGNRFVDSYFEQEKSTLEQDIKGLVNDKRSYAQVRLIALMCAEEPYGIYKYGDLKDLPGLKNQDVFAHYQKLLREHPIDIFCVGQNLEGVARLLSSLIPPRQETVELAPKTQSTVAEARYFEETMDVNQAILVLGYRTNCSYHDDDYYALLVANGILGGFAHSKLFVNVREKASLAYFVGSGLEGSKGLLTITAGISPDQEEQALAIIAEQVKALQSGDITSEELEQTKRGITGAMTTITDSPAGVIDRNLLGLVEGEYRSLDQVVEAIWKVTHDDCVRVMQSIQLDTTYVLKSDGSKEGAEDATN